jgi:hypothetical protein
MNTIITHTEPKWASKVGVINGAYTYSVDLVNNFVKEIDGILTNSLISTCPLLNTVDIDKSKHYDVVLQFLHTYPYNTQLDNIKQVESSVKCNKLIFVTAYEPYHNYLLAHGYNSIFLPMFVYKTNIVTHRKSTDVRNGRAIMFGNGYKGKDNTFSSCVKTFNRYGIPVDTIQSGHFNRTKKIDRDETFEILSNYSFGVGVGRCALEMLSLNIVTFISGNYFGGLITNQFDFNTQQRVNMNGRVVTYDRDIASCVLYGLSGRVDPTKIYYDTGEIHFGFFVDLKKQLKNNLL